MTQISSALNTYINVNILLVVAFTLWLLARFLLKNLKMQHSFATQLRLLNGIFIATLLSPLVAYLYNYLAANGLLPASLRFNLSDFMLTQYLNGNIDLKPVEMEQVLTIRETLETSLINPGGGLGRAIVALVLIGFAACILRCSLAATRLRRIIAQSYPWRRFGHIHLRLSDQSVVPFSTRGLRRRYIVLPAEMLLRPQDMRIALAHEFQHLRQHDVEWEIGFELFKSFFFWNPVVHFWKRQIEQLRELSCDQQVLLRHRVDVRAYCDCLLRVCEDTLKRQPLKRIALPRISLVQFDRSWFRAPGLVLLRRRVDSLFETGAAPDRKMASFWLMGLLTLILLFATIAIQRPQGWSHDRLMLSSIINLERLEELNGKYPIMR
ncbi:MAG TPA: M56 family metallopeptidase [Rhodobacteraceae bacterium]|nr:M56 family metallopeptidase [Paracoccaceae bacterium]